MFLIKFYVLFEMCRSFLCICSGGYGLRRGDEDGPGGRESAGSIQQWSGGETAEGNLVAWSVGTKLERTSVAPGGLIKL